MKIGLAMSGGGARGIAHLGILQAMEEIGIKLCMLSGSSAGAIAGALYGYGYKPQEILEILIKTKLFKFIRPAMNMTGILKLDKTAALYRQYIEIDAFENLKIPLTIAATDIAAGRTRYFSSGELIRPIMASACIPVIFDPILVDGKLYIDGGMLNNMPVEPLIVHCDRIIGLNCNPVGSHFKGGSMKSLLERSLLMAINYNVYDRKQFCDLFLEPQDLNVFSVFDFAKAKEIYDIGYQYAISKSQEIEAILK